MDENDSEKDNKAYPQSDENNSSTQKKPNDKNLFPINLQNGMIIKNILSQRSYV